MKIKFLVLLVVLLATIFYSAGFVKAQTADNSATIAQLQAEIAQLTAQLQQLIAQQGGQQSWCHSFNSYLTAGMGQGANGGPSDEVSNLQIALKKSGFDLSGDDNGTFGDSTAAAVVAFQGQNNIRQTGTVGPLTRAKLNSLYGCGITPVLPINPTPIACTPNWQCQWSQCQNGYQSQSATDSNNCRIPLNQATIACPAIAKSCTSSNQQIPTVTLIVAGDSQTPTIQSGTSVDLRWTSANANNGCSVSSTPNDSSIAITNKLPANDIITVRPTTSTTYTVTCYYVDNNYQTTQGSASVTINVTTATVTPSITITSPSGGQTYSIGSSIPVTFTTSGLAGVQIQPVLINSDTNQAVYGFTPIINSSDGTQTINETIPTNVSAGNNYAIKVIGMPTSVNCNITTPGCMPLAISAGSFSIVAQ